jgi:hypothetical protein
MGLSMGLADMKATEGPALHAAIIQDNYVVIIHQALGISCKSLLQILLAR